MEVNTNTNIKVHRQLMRKEKNVEIHRQLTD